MRQDSGEEVRASFSAADAMRLTRIKLQIIRQVGIDQLLNELNGVLDVYVVISRALDQQQASLKISGCVVHRIITVDVRVHPRQTQVSLGIDRIVILPIRHRGDRHAGTKTVAMGERVQGEAPTPTPAPPPKPLGIELRMRLQSLVQSCDLIP